MIQRNLVTKTNTLNNRKKVLLSLWMAFPFAACDRQSEMKETEVVKPDVCEIRCSCEGCSQSERQDCDEQLDLSEEHAEQNSCNDVWLVYTECVQDLHICSNDILKIDDQCQQSKANLVECMGDDSPPLPGLNACEAFAIAIMQKYEECGGTIVEDSDSEGNSEPIECTEELQITLACHTMCYENASCGVILGDIENTDDNEWMRYSECISGCV